MVKGGVWEGAKKKIVIVYGRRRNEDRVKTFRW
jgi:hypothetical protein